MEKQYHPNEDDFLREKLKGTVFEGDTSNMNIKVRKFINDIPTGIGLLISSLFPTNRKKFLFYKRALKFVKEGTLEEYHNLPGYKLCVYSMNRILQKYKS